VVLGDLHEFDAILADFVGPQIGHNRSGDLLPDGRNRCDDDRCASLES
jgi:hypothetical protein